MIKDLKFAFACQSKTKSVKRSLNDEMYRDQYDYSPPNYGPDFAPVYWEDILLFPFSLTRISSCGLVLV